MSKRISALLTTVFPLGFAPIVALGATCGDYPLTQAQADYLQAQQFEIKVPEGEVPQITRCDVDGNNIIDNNDLFIIREHRGQAAAHPDDPMDWDGDNVIHGRDVGGCAKNCTSNGCAVKEQAEEEGLQAAIAMGEQDVYSEPAACFQADDFDADGSQDLVAIYEYTGTDTRANDWLLQVTFLTEDEFGSVEHITFPYTGQVSNGDLEHHLSYQPAGVVDLNPGSVTLETPGIVSYRKGEPEVLYYYVNGVLKQAFFGIND